MKRLIAFCFLIMALSLLGAQEFRFEGFVDYFGGIEASRGYENLETRVYMEPTFLGYHDPTGLEWVLSAKLLVKPMGEPASIDPWDILGETYLFLPLGKFDFLLGQKLVTYGFADVFGPLNALHSTHRAVLSLDEKYESRRPDPLVQIKYYPTFYDSLELTYVPVTRPDVEQTGPVFLPLAHDYVLFEKDPYLMDHPHSLFFNYTRFGEKMDWQLFYGFYTENTPDFVIESYDGGATDYIRAEYNRKHTLGAAYSTRLGNSTLSQDIAFSLTSDFDGSDPGVQNSEITVNTQYLTNLPWGVLSQTTLVYSYFFNHGAHGKGSDAVVADYLAKEISGFHLQPLPHIAFVVAHFEKSFLREKLKSQLNVGFFFSPEIYFGPRLAYSLSDYWALETGLDLTLGDPPDSDLRRNPSDDNYYIRAVFRY